MNSAGEVSRPAPALICFAHGDEGNNSCREGRTRRGFWLFLLFSLPLQGQVNAEHGEQQG